MSLTFSFIDNDILGDIADAIRFVDGTTPSIAPKDYAERIKAFTLVRDYFWIKSVASTTNTVTITKTGTPTTGTDLSYSVDGINWSPVTYTENVFSISLNQNEKLFLRSTTGFSSSDSAYYTISSSANIEVGGDITTLIDYTSTSSSITIPTRSFHNMCYNNTYLISAEELDFSKVTSVGNYGLYYCFYGCTSLTTAPDLSNVTTIGSNGLARCFYNCSSLSTAPNLSNVTSIGDYGLYYCFYGCTSLTTAPDLSNVTTIGSNGLYGCFYYCSKLVAVTAPNIQSLTTNILNSWLAGAGTQATGTKVVRVPAGATIAADSESGIPIGWTRVDY